MPGYDRKGPMGGGPMTGGGRGRCMARGRAVSMDVPADLGPTRGRGYGRGYGNGYGNRCFRAASGQGMGFGWRYRQSDPDGRLTGPQEQDILETEAARLEKELAALRSRLAVIEAKPDDTG